MYNWNFSEVNALRKGKIKNLSQEESCLKFRVAEGNFNFILVTQDMYQSSMDELFFIQGWKRSNLLIYHTVASWTLKRSGHTNHLTLVSSAIWLGVQH